MQFHYFRSAAKLFKSMLNTNSSVTLRRVVQADLILQPRPSARWTAQLLSAFQGLRGSCVQAVQTGRAILKNEFTANLKRRMRGVWRRDAELVDPNAHNNKLATYYSSFAIPLSSNECMPTSVPQYHYFNLSKMLYAMHVSRLRLRAHQHFESQGSVAWRRFSRM